MYGLLSEARDIKRNDVEIVRLDLKQSWAGVIKIFKVLKMYFQRLLQELSMRHTETFENFGV